METNETPPLENKNQNDEKIPVVFPDRFDPEYLTYLSTLLEIDNLKKSALTQEKEIDGVVYTKCISIDFCGLASNTLLGTDMGRSEVAKSHTERRLVADKFKNLMSKETLKDLKIAGYYIQIRFSFSYLFADYPVCLIKAELPDNWHADYELPRYDFYISDPIRESEFKGSSIYISQIESLGKIKALIKENPEILILAGSEKRLNTIQVRFPVIPNNLCSLIINNVALCDTYLYARIKGDSRLELNYPLCVIHKERDHVSFLSVRRHWEYLWTHDLTLFCSDATEFHPVDNIDGLVTLRQPFDEFGTINLPWAHKENRIKEHKLRRKDELNFTQPNTQNHIDNWKKNLNRKLDMCLRKIPFEQKKGTSDPGVIEKNSGIVPILKIGIIQEGNETKFVTEINWPKKPSITIYHKDPDKAFRHLFYLSIEKKKGYESSLNLYASEHDKYRLHEAIIDKINTKYDDLKEKHLDPSDLFKKNINGCIELNLEPNQILILNEEILTKLKAYKESSLGIFLKLLSYLLKDIKSENYNLKVTSEKDLKT